MSRGPEKNGEGNLSLPRQPHLLDRGQGVKATEQAVSGRGLYKQSQVPGPQDGPLEYCAAAPVQSGALYGQLGSWACAHLPEPSAECSAEGSHKQARLSQPSAQGRQAWESSTLNQPCAWRTSPDPDPSIAVRGCAKVYLVHPVQGICVTAWHPVPLDLRLPCLHPELLLLPQQARPGPVLAFTHQEDGPGMLCLVRALMDLGWPLGW